MKWVTILWIHTNSPGLSFTCSEVTSINELLWIFGIRGFDPLHIYRRTDECSNMLAILFHICMTLSDFFLSVFIEIFLSWLVFSPFFWDFPGESALRSLISVVSCFIFLWRQRAHWHKHMGKHELKTRRHAHFGGRWSRLKGLSPKMPI